jgi:HSP20 family protein
MENEILYDTNCSIYPGDYVPTIQIKDVEEELAHIHTKEYVEMNMKELKDSYVLEVAIPGVKNENFLLEASGNIVSIRMLQRECDDVEGESFILHKLNCRCFDRKITLPKNVDTDFIDAQYKAGILRLHVPKANKLSKNLHTRIVVY